MFKLGTPVEFPGRLIRSSLGQSANIGDLYDAKTDRFTGQSVVTRTTKRRFTVKATPMESSEEECLTDDILYDRLVSLVNEKELQLSVVLGLVEDINMSPMHGVFLRTLATLREEVESITDIKRLVSSRDITVSERATHVVVGVVWGATVAVCLDRNDSDVQSRPSVNESSSDLQMLMSILKSGVRPNSQDLFDINKTYTIRCFSNCLPHSQQRRTLLEDALSVLSDLPRLIHSANNGKGAPLSFILMPLSLLTERTTSVPVRIEDSLLIKTLALLREVTNTKGTFSDLSGLLGGHKNYLPEQEIGKIDEFVAGFQDAEKKLYDDVARAVVAVRSGQLDQSRLADILDAFSHGLYSVDSVKVFYDNLEPTLQKLEFFDELIREGIVIIGNSLTDLRALTRDPDVYILYATEGAKRQHPRLWEENSSAFLDIVRQEKRKHKKRLSDSNVSTFAYVDSDIVPAANVEKSEIAIYRYRRGEVVSRDVAEERAVVASMNIAKSSQEKQPFPSRPVKRALVELACPATNSNCGSSQRVWSCEVCKEEIEYGFDDCDYFYCSCGRAPVNTFSYKCNGSSHGDDYFVFPPHVVEEHVKNFKPLPELNILFLGETGVGKSTWINGFANYMSYSTLSEAENSKSVCIIPTKFTMTNENLEEVEIKTGTDKNEDQKVGQSSTQMPKSYVFRHGKINVRIIDTPGMGDTRGISQDKVNFQRIMTHLSHFDEINGICVLLKPNNARLNVMFEFCIKELLTHLHRDACKNIVFCFTNARSTFYKPGDTLPALRQLITDSAGIDLQLSKETVYCIDNESVRFLAALKQGIGFDEKEKNNYATSWEMSVKETERLIDYISFLQPHKVKHTLSLNEARRLILELSRPLGEITKTIQNNIEVIEQRRRDIQESRKHKADLIKELYIPAIDLQSTPLDNPRTVCTAKSCVKYISVGGAKKINYVTHCHPRCNLTGVQTNVVNCVALQQCAAMVDKSYCNHCGCSWSVHMHITYETDQVPIQVVDVNVDRQIKDKVSKIEIIKQHLQSLEERIDILKAEKCKVAKVSAKFACFLKHNAIAPYNDAIFDYLECLIQLEKGKVNVGGDKSVLAGLEEMKTMYKEEVGILEKAISDQTSSVRVPTEEEIKKLYDDLCCLEITGSMLKDAVKVAEISDVRAMQCNEKRFQPCRKPPHSGNIMEISQPRRSIPGRIRHELRRIINIVWW